MDKSYVRDAEGSWSPKWQTAADKVSLTVALPNLVAVPATVEAMMAAGSQPPEAGSNHRAAKKAPEEGAADGADASAEQETAATARPLADTLLTEASVVPAAAEVTEEQVLADCREYLDLERLLKAIRGEESFRTRKLADIRRMTDSLTGEALRGASNPMAQQIAGNAISHRDWAEAEFTAWKAEVQLTQREARYAELHEHMLRYFPFRPLYVAPQAATHPFAEAAETPVTEEAILNDCCEYRRLWQRLVQLTTDQSHHRRTREKIYWETDQVIQQAVGATEDEARGLLGKALARRAQAESQYEDWIHDRQVKEIERSLLAIHVRMRQYFLALPL